MSQDEFNVETIMHLTCTNMEPGMVDSALMVIKPIFRGNLLRCIINPRLPRLAVFRTSWRLEEVSPSVYALNTVLHYTYLICQTRLVEKIHGYLPTLDLNMAST